MSKATTKGSQMKTVSVTVEQRHIDEARRLAVNRDKSLCSTCPVALALHESGYPGAYVKSREWIPDLRRVCRWEDLPRDVSAWIADFDAGRPVSPQTFILPLEVA